MWRYCGVNLESLCNYKMILVLLFVVAVNLVVAALVWQLDFFVHGELYSYSLVYSHDWADSYWYYTAMLWAFLGGATAIAASAIAPHYLHSRKISGFSMWTGFFLPILALVYQGLSIFFFDQKSSVINSLSSYGLSFNNGWVATYSLLSQSILVLMIVAFLALIIPAVRSFINKLRMKLR